MDSALRKNERDGDLASWIMGHVRAGLFQHLDTEVLKELSSLIRDEESRRYGVKRREAEVSRMKDLADLHYQRTGVRIEIQSGICREVLPASDWRYLPARVTRGRDTHLLQHGGFLLDYQWHCRRDRSAKAPGDDVILLPGEWPTCRICNRGNFNSGTLFYRLTPNG